MSVNGIGGVLVVDKPSGPTSHDVVAIVRRALGMRRVGHCGTLDPLATGVLVVCIGPMTRLSQWLTGGDKEYEACFHLGATSDTDDALGEVEMTSAPVVPTREEIIVAVERFVGVIDQVPPDHSAVKVDGVRSYRRARRREPTRLAARSVRIDRFDVVEYQYPRLRVQVRCGKGTYIRSLARDIGQTLGCGGYVEQLRRLRVGPLTMRDAIRPSDLDSEGVDGMFVDPRRALEGILEVVDIDPDASDAFVHGGVVSTRTPLEPGDRAVFHGARLLGVGRITEDGCLRPVTVLAETTAAN